MRSSVHQIFTFLSIVILAGMGSRVLGQVTIPENDTTICLGASRTLTAVNAAGLPVGAQISVDDRWSAPIALSFPFTFYGSTYTQCLISTNGLISFTLARAGTTSQWLTAANGAVPGNNDVINSIMTHYADIDPTVSGQITYTYAGVAPNRKFIVTYCDVPMWSCPTITTSFQTVLYEGSNKIEMFLRNKPVCSAWGGVAIQGLQNELGAIAHVVPGRNFPNVWTAVRDGRRFTPDGPSNYIIDSIPYTPIALAGNTGFTWYTLPNTIVGTAPTLNVTPTRTTTYYVRQVYCADTTIDSVRIIVGGNPQIDTVGNNNPIRTGIVNPSYCGASDGTLTLRGLDTNVLYNVHYSKNGFPQPDIAVTSSSTGAVTIPNLSSGIYSYISVSVGVCEPGNEVGPYTLTNPPIPVNFTTQLKPSCGGIDTVVFTNTTPIPGTINYIWNFGDGGTSTDKDPTHVYNSQNIYSVLITADNGICRDSLRKTVDTRHPLVANFVVDYDTACIDQVLNFRDTSVFVAGSTPPTYFWDFGDNTTSTGNAPIHAYTQAGTYRVRMVIQDFVPCRDTVYKDIYVSNTPTTTFTTSPSTLCEGQGSLFSATFAGATPVSYEWTFSDGTVVGNQNPILHAFDASGTYSVKISTHYAFCPDTFFTEDIQVHPFPTVNIGPDTALCPGSEAIPLTDLTDNIAGAQYAWNTGATTPGITVSTDGTYSVTKTVDGCSVTDSVTIFKNCYLDIPNTFSPNGDGLNDYFLPRQLLSRGVVSYKMSVYNRWGQIIFETANIDGRGWDGRFNSAVQPQGVYVYIIDVAFRNGQKEHYTGNITLIR
jgi:gliding motility-associated-like protein